jgi:DNA modification methylase
VAQAFKSVYFPDHPGDTAKQRNVKLAFGKSDRDLFAAVKPLTGQELRELIGHSSYRNLQQAAATRDLALNTFCVRVLRQRIGIGKSFHKQETLPGLERDSALPIDPIQATFRGGKAEPLQGWYPLLEGYSPQFVTRVMQEFAPNAEQVFDPFSGTGTTPLTVAAMGRLASYCEINPLLQFLTAGKALAATMPESGRESVARRLESLADDLSARVKDEEGDAGLLLAYGEVFGKSRFFDDDIFGKVLRLRKLLDALACEDAEVSHLATIAVLASLIPSSRLIRRGDLRFKTDKELKRCRKNLLRKVKERLLAMAADLRRLTPIAALPRLVCEDARCIGRIPLFGADAVVTSPPYLNGTNYFRNTKVELWFLRCLTSKQDLAGFRYRSVAGGINDVTAGKPAEAATLAVENLVRELGRCAYDQRIPMLVKSYFHDMAEVFGGIACHLRKGSRLVIDIGDSAYCGIHIPTHRMLAELLQEKGFDVEREITLRKRMSRGGMPLSQVLLVAHKRGQRQRKRATKLHQFQLAWYVKWRTFKATLPHQRGEFAKRNWGHPLHSLCSYQGKMKPSLAFHLVRTFVPPEGRMLDPFGGVGTIAFEAALQGMHAWTFDISPAAVQIAAAKIGIPDRDLVAETIERLNTFLEHNSPTKMELESTRAIRINGPLNEYFHPDTLSEILLARRYFLEHPPRTPAESLVFSSLLHILHGNRPYALSRRSHPITPFSPTGAREYRSLIPRLRAKVHRGLEVHLPSQFKPGHSLFQDATAWWPQEVTNLDAIITSPPFYDSTRFYLANWMRLWFAGWGAEDFRSRPKGFIDERQKKNLSVYEALFRQARERLSTGGVMILHLGKSSKCDMAAALSDMARPWFNVVDVFAEDVGHCESHGIRDKGTVAQHAYLVLT